MTVIDLILLVYLLLITSATAKTHHLFVGNLLLPASIHALEFNDETLTLIKTKTIAADSSHAWVAFDVCTFTNHLLQTPTPYT